jgi:inhibitor of cysteine peptidase
MLAAVVLVAGTVAAVIGLRHRTIYGTVLDESRLTATVDRGDRFSLAVPDGGSIGDEWSATVTPDGVLTTVDNRMVMRSLHDRLFGPLAGGGAGTRYFVYLAARQGTATIRLFDCFQGACRIPDDRSSRAVTWTITVR